MGKVWHLIPILGIAFCSLQCVETLITVKVLPDGQYLMNFTTRGDSADVFNNDFPHPRGARWTSSIRKKTSPGNGDTIWVQESEALLRGASFPPDPSPAPLSHPLTVEKKPGLFSTIYTLNQTFTGRRAFQKYPEFAKNLNARNVDQDTTRWIAEALYYMVTKAMEDLQTDSTVRIAPDLKERIQNHLRGVFYRVHEKALFEDLSQWESFLQTSLKPFSPHLPRRYLPTLLTSVKIYREELMVTSQLEDDNFIYQATLPGQVVETNADSLFGDTLKWYFTLEDFINDDYQITARSIFYSTRRIQAAILIGTLVILGILILRFKKRLKP